MDRNTLPQSKGPRGADRHSPADPPASLQPTTRELFAGFLVVGLSGFGGVLSFARRMLVERRRWLSEREFIEVLSLSQFLPGPNIVNVSIVIGRRFRGPAGALAASTGLMLMPLVIILLLASLFGRFADVAAVRGATNGVSAAAAGLMLAIALKMARPIRRSAWQVAIAATVFAGIGIARLPLLWVLAAVAPLSIAIAWRWRE